MKTNIFIFHGTEGHPGENWFPWLKDKCETTGANVTVPQFPSPPVIPAKISEWFDVLKQYEDEITENTIIVGHSLGGVFTLRVLEKLEHPIKAAFLVGAPIGVKPILNYDRDSSFSGFDFDWPNIVDKAKSFEVFQSDDDPYVSLGNGQELANRLGIDLTFVRGAGHFNKSAGFTSFDLLWQKLEPLLK